MDDEVSKDGEDGRGSHGGEDEFVFGRLLHGVHCSVWCACGQAESVRNEGEEDEDHGDAHGEEGDEEHIGGAAAVVHAPIITYPGEDARGISKKILPCPKVSISQSGAEKGAKKGLLYRSQGAYIASCLTNQGTPKKLRDSYKYKKQGLLKNS